MSEEVIQKRGRMQQSGRTTATNARTHRNVYPRVRLAGEKELSLSHLRVLGKEVLQRCKIVCSCGLVPRVVVVSRRVREANPDRILKPKHIGELRPPKLAQMQPSAISGKWSILCEESTDRRASEVSGLFREEGDKSELYLGLVRRMSSRSSRSRSRSIWSRTSWRRSCYSIETYPGPPLNHTVRGAEELSSDASTATNQ